MPAGTIAPARPKNFVVSLVPQHIRINVNGARQRSTIVCPGLTHRRDQIIHGHFWFYMNLGDRLIALFCHFSPLGYCKGYLFAMMITVFQLEQLVEN